MAFSFFSFDRTVLLVSDEALYVYLASGKHVKFIDEIRWDFVEFESHLAELLEKKCKKRPVLILHNQVEQHYRKESISFKGVGFLDRQPMVERKLAFSFPNYPIRAQMSLKKPKAKGKATLKGKQEDQVYIFAAVPSTDNIKNVLAIVESSKAALLGLVLLPVESSSMVYQLSDKLRSVGVLNKKPKWTVFLGQHADGGLRQIVIKEGQIALTRMTFLQATQARSKQWAEEVFEEFTSTMSYVSRFGYQNEDGLNVVCVADLEAGGALAQYIEPLHDYTALLPSKVAERVGLSGLSVRDGERGFADQLHVAWAAQKKSFTLPMHSEEIDSVINPYRFLKFLMVFLTLGVLGSFIYFGMLFVDFLDVRSQLSDEVSKNSQAKALYEKELERSEAEGMDLRLIQGVYSIYQDLEKEDYDVSDIMYHIGQALGRDLRLDRFKAEYAEVKEGTPFANQQKERRIILQMSYPPETDIAQANLEIDGLRDRLAESLTGYDVTITKRLSDMDYVETLVIGSEDSDGAQDRPDFVVEIVLEEKSQ